MSVNLCITSNKNLIQTLDTPAKIHGKEVQTSDSAILSYQENQSKWKATINNTTNISKSINKKIFDFYEK